jgi:uncharacterized protein (TIGR02246 family)
MRALRIGLVWLAALAVLGPATARAADSSEEIKQVLTRQVDDWNRGDVESFMAGYEASPETTFIGKTIQHGYESILARYKTAYSSKEAMGTLVFSDLKVRMLGAEYAVVTGSYHLTRTASGGGDAGGVFSLVFRKNAQGWHIILDHTS